MSKHRSLLLANEQRAHLENLIRSGVASARTLTRARILLLTDRSQGDKRTDEQVSQALLCSKGTVQNVRHRCLDEGVEAALVEKPRPGQTPKITGEVEAQLIATACSAPPTGKARWTLQMLADKLVELQLVESISDVAIMKRLKKRLSSPGR